MDYSKFYHDWLQLDLAPEEDPNFYQILGLKNMEPDVQKIETAFRNTLNSLQDVNGMTNPEAFTVIVSRVLEAHKVFLNPNQKHLYDLQLSQSTGERIWKGYERPSFLTRVRQMSLIALSFALGLGVVAVMALSVERNPDGSIIFREEAQARKVPPFASQLDYVVYRPSIAQDYQPNGYTVAMNKAAHKTGQLLTAGPSETSESGTEAPNTELPDTNQIAENQSTESEMEEFSQILSEKIATPKSEEIAKVNRRSPLYRKIAALEEHSENPKDISSEEEQLEPEVVANADSQQDVEIAATIDPQEDLKLEAPADVPEKTEPQIQKSVVSLSNMITTLEKVHSYLDFSKPDTAETYVQLQYVTICEYLQELIEKDVTVDPEEIQEFIGYSLKVTTGLGWKKRFPEAYLLCDKMKEFCAKYETEQVLNDKITRQYDVIKNYEALYKEAMGISEKLKQAQYANDKELNTKYAMWLWQETGEIQNSIQYFAKCKYPTISEAAQKEMELVQNKAMNNPQKLRDVADSWWDIAEKQLTNERQKTQVKEHAKKFYLKVLQMDSSLLNDVQKARVASL